MAKPKAVGRREKRPREGTSVRLDDDTRARLAAIAAADEPRIGYLATSADVLRGCLRRGIEAREDELGIKRGKR